MPPKASTVWTPGIVLPAASCTPSVVTLIKATLAPAHVVGLTAWGEARARHLIGDRWDPNPIDALLDILDVIDNRARDSSARWGDHRDVCFARGQFACWSATANAATYDAVLEKAQQILAGDHLDQKLSAAIRAAELVLTGSRAWTMPFPNDTCHYYSDLLLKPPAWAVDRMPVAVRYGYLFFAGIA